jgi:prephenate dehydrogenase
VIGENSIVLRGRFDSSICEAVTNHPKISSQHTHCRYGIFRTIGSNKGLYEGKTNIICEVERTAFKLQEKALELLKLWECAFDTWIQSA